MGREEGRGVMERSRHEGGSGIFYKNRRKKKFIVNLLKRERDGNM